MNPKRPSVVGLLTTRSMPRNSAPWGGVGGSSAAAAVGMHPRGRYSGRCSRCSQRGGSCPLQKKATVEAPSTVLRHCLPRFVGRSIPSPPGAKLNLTRGAGCQVFLSKHGAGAPRPPASGRFTANAAEGPTKGTFARHQPLWWRGNGAPRKQQKPQTAAVERRLPQLEVHSAQALGRRRSRPRPLPCPLHRPP